MSKNTTLGTKSINLGGFTYPTVDTPIDKPDGALITDGFIVDSATLAYMNFQWVPFEEFRSMVQQGYVKSVSLDGNGKLVLPTFRFGLRNTNIMHEKTWGAEDTAMMGAYAAVAHTALKSKQAVKAVAENVAPSVPDAVESTARTAFDVTVDMSTDAAAEAATAAAIESVGVTTAEATADTAIEAGSSSLPVAIAIIGTLAVSFASYGLHGYFTRDKIYEYNQVRLLTSHAKRAEVEMGCIALSFVGVMRKVTIPFVVFVAYGRGLLDWMNTVSSQHPDLRECIERPYGNMTLIHLPMDVFMNTDLSLGYELMYNSQLLHQDVLSSSMASKTDISVDDLAALMNKMDGEKVGTINDMAEVVDASQNVKDYCAKFNMTENEFWDTEAPRLCKVMDCSNKDLAARLSVLL